ncbi:hypothetical protein [Pseudomonas sp. UM16]|uniref:hypothetical protein n=1 Tax=Pseudomonas sp. UM16 TaxID=3158962 RepID=UPI003D091B0C
MLASFLPRSAFICASLLAKFTGVLVIYWRNARSWIIQLTGLRALGVDLEVPFGKNLDLVLARLRDVFPPHGYRAGLNAQGVRQLLLAAEKIGYFTRFHCASSFVREAISACLSYHVNET